MPLQRQLFSWLFSFFQQFVSYFILYDIHHGVKQMKLHSRCGTGTQEGRKICKNQCGTTASHSIAIISRGHALQACGGTSMVSHCWGGFQLHLLKGKLVCHNTYLVPGRIGWGFCVVGLSSWLCFNGLNSPFVSLSFWRIPGSYERSHHDTTYLQIRLWWIPPTGALLVLISALKSQIVQMEEK